MYIEQSADRHLRRIRSHLLDAVQEIGEDLSCHIDRARQSDVAGVEGSEVPTVGADPDQTAVGIAQDLLDRDVLDVVLDGDSAHLLVYIFLDQPVFGAAGNDLQAVLVVVVDDVSRQADSIPARRRTDGTGLRILPA